MKKRYKGETNVQHINQLKETRYLIDEVARLESDTDNLNSMPWKSEQMFGELLEAVPEMIFTTDPKGNILYTNRAWSEHIGYSYDEVKSINIFDLVHPENLEAAKKRFSEVFKANSPRVFESKSRTKYGFYIDVQISLSPMLDSEGDVVAAFGIGRDITEYKQVIDELRDSEEMHRTIIENSPGIIFTTDTEGIMLSVNNASKPILGFGSQEIVGRHFTDFIRNEDSLPRILEDYHQVISGKKVANETVIIRKDMEERHLEFITVPITKNGVVAKTLGMVHDITEHKRAEEKLRRMFDSVADGVIVTDLQGTITELNERTAELHGYDSKDKLLGKSVLKLIAPSDCERVVNNVYETIKLGPIRNIEYRLLRKDGSWLWGELNASVLKDTYGKPVGFIFITRDISERKRSEEMLRSSQAKLQSIVEAMPDRLFHISRDGTFLNEPMGRIQIQNWLPDTFYGKTLHDISPIQIANRIQNAIETALDNNTPQLVELHMTATAGDKVILEARIVPCRGDEVIVIARDITDRRQSEERLRAYQQQLHSLTSQLSQTEERERRRLAADLHDLIGQPLAVVKMKLNTWKDILHSSGHANAMKEVLELLGSAIRNTRTLTSDLSPHVLYELGLEAGLEALLEQFQERHAIFYEYEDDGQEKPIEDEVGIVLYRCIGELLMNVVKHAKAQVVKLSICREDSHVLITIEDDGIGFAIPEPGGAQGFGLFSIHERLNWINGSFTIQSQPGRGTRATLKAPLKQIKNGI